MPSRVSLIMQSTSAPTDGTAAIPHTGGWSEGFWQNGDIASDDPKIIRLAQKRALLLPVEAAVVGYRIALYTLLQNKLVPRGTSVAKQLFPGNPGYTMNLPQDALEMSGKTSGGPNSSRFMLRALPDGMVSNGEYQPSAGFKTAVTQMVNNLVADGWGFVGRDLTIATPRVYFYRDSDQFFLGDSGLDAQIGDYVRFIKAFDNAEDPITGSYRVLAILTAGQDVKLLGVPAFAGPQITGRWRVDRLKFLPYTSATPSRARVKKIGRPFESYRGRASNRR